MTKRPPPRKKRDTASAKPRREKPPIATDSVDDVRPSIRERRSPRRTKPNDDDSRPDLPIEKVAYGLCVLIVVFGWCAMANAYHSETIGRPEVLETSSDAVSGLMMVLAMIWTFVTSSVIYLASIRSVLSFVLKEKLIIPIAMFLALAGVFAFVRFSDRVKEDLERGFERSSQRRESPDERKARAMAKRRRR